MFVKPPDVGHEICRVWKSVVAPIVITSIAWRIPSEAEKIADARLGELAKSAALLLDRADKLDGTQATIDQATVLSDALSKLSAASIKSVQGVDDEPPPPDEAA